MTDLDFNRQVAQLSPLLKSLAYNFTKDYVLAQDLQQDTLLKAYKYRDRFEEGSNFKAWISTIMRFTFINDYRKLKVRQSISRTLELSDVITVGDNSEENLGAQSLEEGEIISSIMRLSPLYSVPFMMHYRGYEYLEIAKRLKLPLGTVKSRIFMARAKLKVALVQYAQ